MAARAIETTYKGYRFRSRLEARWAVFFDALEVQWEYEKEGYDLGEGVLYLPDFWLSREKAWVEIKGAAATADEQLKARRLAQQSGALVVVLAGQPWPDAYTALSFDQHGEGGPSDSYGGGHPVQYLARCRRCPSLNYVTETEGYQEHGALGVCCPTEKVPDPRSKEMMAAYSAARSARFEHGEHGAPTPVRAAKTSGAARQAGADYDWLLEWLSQRSASNTAAAAGPSVGVGPVRAKVLESICVECAGEVRPGRGTRTPDGSAWLCPDCAGRPRSAPGHAPTPAPVKQATPRPVRAIGLPVNPLADANAPALMRVDADAFERFKAQRAMPPVGQRGRAR